MKTINFNPTRMRTYDDCARNPFGMRSYKKQGEGGLNLVPRGCSEAFQ
jgi:hypothetical protein